MRYKKGDKVILRKDLVVGEEYGRISYLSDMLSPGSECRVNDLGSLRFEECKSDFNYSEEMIDHEATTAKHPLKWDFDDIFEQAKQRYPIGTKFKVVHSTSCFTVTSHEKHKDWHVTTAGSEYINMVCDSHCTETASVWLNGKWAEIISEPTSGKRKVTTVDIGARVRLFEDSQFWGQSKGSVGTILGGPTSGNWVWVKWDSGLKQNYRIGDDGEYDLYYAEEEPKFKVGDVIEGSSETIESCSMEVTTGISLRDIKIRIKEVAFNDGWWYKGDVLNSDGSVSTHNYGNWLSEKGSSLAPPSVDKTLEWVTSAKTIIPSGNTITAGPSEDGLLVYKGEKWEPKPKNKDTFELEYPKELF